MRFGYVFLGLVTLTSIHTSSGQCSNGFPGVDRDDICCAASCGVCGGGGCGNLPGGPDNCCTGRIRDTGMVCSATQAAPCIMESTAMCDNGVPGVQLGNICCDAMCGTCGGSGCARRPGGSAYCCVGMISTSGVMCSTTMAAPCIIDDPTPAPTTAAPTTAAPTTAAPTTAAPTTAAPTTAAPTTAAPTTAAPTTAAPTTAAPTTAAPTTAAPTTAAPTTAAPTPTCSNGLSGFQTGTACCAAGCGACGGAGCGGLPGGSSACCVGPITSGGMMCSVIMAAPCIVDN